ncbi:MAG: polysaccharide biosynthesis protein [Clostridia bacterium]|nr:polysaccharide biosynthesis protein [Clostridia bacterium]
MKKFFRSALFLVIAGLIAKAIGALYKVPLVAVLGSEGVGVYQLVFPIYTILLTISSGGIPQAVSVQTASALALGGEGESRKILRVSLTFLSIIGIIGSLLMAVLGGNLARLQGNADATMAYVVLSPSVFLVCVLSAYRGWWQGNRDTFPTAISQLVEQLAKLLFGVFFSKIGIKYGLVYGVMGAVFGITVSEILAVIIVMLYSIIKNRKTHIVACEKKAKNIIADLARIGLPISFASLVLPLTQLIDSVLVVNVLTHSGLSSATATALYGIASAPVSSIINLPPVIMTACATALLPRFSAIIAKGEDISDKAKEGLTYAHCIGLGGFVFILAFARQLLTILYGRGLSQEEIILATVLLSISSVSVPYVCYIQLFSAVMQSKGKAKVPALNLLLGGFLKTGLSALLLQTIGIYGVAISGACSYAVIFTLDFAYCRKSFCTARRRTFTKVVLCSFLALTAVLPILFISDNLLISIFSMLAFVIIFTLSLLISGTITLPTSFIKKIQIRSMKNSKKY